MKTCFYYGSFSNTNRVHHLKLIVYHAKITTLTTAQPQASALDVKSGRIYAVGNDKNPWHGKIKNTLEGIIFEKQATIKTKSYICQVSEYR